MPTSRQMTDEQRRAMFARLNGGGGSSGGSATIPYSYDGAGDTTTSTWTGFWKGFGEGALGGLNIGINNFTHGLTDWLGLTKAGDYVASGDTAYAVSDLLSTVGSSAAWMAMLGGAGSSLEGMAAGQIPQNFTPAGLKLLQSLTTFGQAMEAFRVGNAMDAFRDDRYLQPDLDKALAVVGEAVDIYGGYLSLAGFGQAVSSLRLIPLPKAISSTSGYSLLPNTVGDSLAALLKTTGQAITKPFAAFWSKASQVAPKLSGLAKEVYNLYTKASEVTGGSLHDILNGGTSLVAKVAAGELAVRAGAEKLVSMKTERDAKAAFAKGEDYTLEAANPRGLFGTLGAAAVSTLGNPIEKATRPGAFTPAQQEGVYRAQVSTVKDAYKRGEISKGERDAMLDKLAESKPRNMEGKALYSVEPAMVKFFQWKGGDVTSSLVPTTAEKVKQDAKHSAAVTAAAEKAAKKAQQDKEAAIFASAFGVELPKSYTPKATSSSSKSESLFDNLNTSLGIGLMYTGNTGILSPMGGAGTGIAQAWNAALAGLGAVDYNRKKANAHDRVYTSPLVQAQRDAEAQRQKDEEAVFRSVFGL